MLFILAVTFGFTKAARAQTNYVTNVIILDMDHVYFTDGDTIKYLSVTYRLMGFDTPETFQSKCEQELKLGLEAKEHINKLARGAKEAKLMIHGRDKYARSLAILLLDEKDVAGIMIEAKLAVEYHGRGQRKDWCQQ
jgi:endonuclease YncB( thermonuclease family)